MHSCLEGIPPTLSTGPSLGPLPLGNRSNVPRVLCRVLWGSPASPCVPAASSCGGLLTQPSGSFASPFYPGNYPNNARCVWDIEVPNNYRVTVVFRDVQ